MYHIYKITNKINGKNYIGFTSKKRPQDRWSEHKSSAKNGGQNAKQNIVKAISKHGHENFAFEVLYSHSDKTHVLKEMEDKFISEYNAMGPYGYNMTKGGGGQVSPSAETRKKMSEAKKGNTPWNKGKKNSQVPWNKGLTKEDPRVAKNIESAYESRKNGAGWQAWNKGLDKSDTRVAKYSENSVNKKGKTAWNKGLTKETDERVADNAKKVYESRKQGAGWTPWNKGLKTTF